MYVEISESLALGETSSTAFDGARGKIAYDHSQSTGNPHNTTKADIGLGNVDNTADADKKVSEAGKVSHYLTIQKNGNTVITYNGSLEKIANITVPTKTSELINDSDFVGSTGTIDVAKKVGTTTVGGSTTPVYINEGIPTAIGYSIAKSVPADAVFTDTTYSNATQSKAGLMSALDKTKLDSISDDLTIPTKLSELTNDSNFIASTELSGSDLNNVLTPGFYYGAYEANNKPTGSRITFGLKVYKIAAHTAQEFINAVDLRTWIRYYNNSSWSSWTERLFTDTTYNEATTSADGLMSFEDKSKLNGIAIGATRLTGSTFTVGLNVINKVITPGDSTTLDYDITNFTASQVSNGLMSAADKIKLDGIESNTNTSINGEFIKYNVSEGSEITEYVSVEMFNKISAGYSIDYTSTLGTGYNRMILSTRRYTSGTIETLIMVLASDNIYSSIPLTEIAFSIDSDYDSDVVFLGANGPYSGGGGEACFTGDTLVLTDNGLKPIEEIKVNDLVMSYNFETKEQELKPVVAIISHNTKYVYNVISENNVIKATGDHPVHSNEYGKINVSQLTSNCSLLMHNNIKDSIININMEEKSCVVYDLSVQDNHTYYVGYKPVLVYNESITNIYN